MTQRIRIGVSACLLGEYVRYDGAHKLDRCITEIIAEHFTCVPVCPEVGCGLPVPREAMRLEGNRDAPRLLTVATRIDLTDRMLDYCAARLNELKAMELCGFIFKERSPSCGVAAVPLYVKGVPEPSAVGLFAGEVSRHFPLMPLEEAERLDDPDIRNTFIKSVVRYHRQSVLK